MWYQVHAPIPLSRPSLQTWTDLVHQTYFLPVVLPSHRLPTVLSHFSSTSTAPHMRSIWAVLPCRYKHTTTAWFSLSHHTTKNFSFSTIHAQHRYSLGATHTNLLGFGPHVVSQRTPPRFKYKVKLLQSQKAYKESFLADLSSPNDIPSYIPAQTLKKIRK